MIIMRQTAIEPRRKRLHFARKGLSDALVIVHSDR